MKMGPIKSLNLALSLFFVGTLSGSSIINGTSPAGEVLAHWRFEHIKHLTGDSISTSIVGQPLSADNCNPIEPQHYIFDESGKENFLQARAAKASPNVSSDDVPTSQVDGKPNTRSLALKNVEYVVTFNLPLAYYDMQKKWTIEASLKCKLHGAEQVCLCEDGANGQLSGDVTIFSTMMEPTF